MNSLKKRLTPSKKIKPVLKSFNCPNCGSTLNIKAVGITVSVVCSSCHATVDTNSAELTILETAQRKRTYKPDIPLGSRGKISGSVYECIGFMVLREGDYFWREYLLYNPYRGFRWLFEMNGHWSFTKRVRNLPAQIPSGAIDYKDKFFVLFNKGESKVEYVEGEFYWRVMRGDQSQIMDYIHPPYLLSRERTVTEVSWSLSIYLEKERLQKAFKLKSLPEQHGVAPNQPSAQKKTLRKNFKICAVAVVAACAIFLLRSATAKKQILLSHDGTIAAAVRSSPEIALSEKFLIEDGGKNLSIEVRTNVLNSWIFFDTLLVSAETGKGVPMPLEVSYYKGRDWSEGSTKSSKEVFNIPRGEYYLSTKFQRGGLIGRELYYRLVLKSDIPILSNLIIVVIILLIIPLGNFLSSSGFEMKRWTNSSEADQDG